MCRTCVGLLESDLTPGRAAKPDPFFRGVASSARAFCEERPTRVDIELCLEVVEVLRERLVEVANVREWVRLDERYSLAYFVKYLFSNNPQWQGYDSEIDPSTGEPWRKVKLADVVCQRLLACQPYAPLTLAVADRFSTAAITTSGEIADLERSLFREMQQPTKTQDKGQIQRYWAQLKAKYRDEWCQQYQATLWNLRKQHENQWNDFMGQMCRVCVRFERRMYTLVERARSAWVSDSLETESGKEDKDKAAEKKDSEQVDVSLLDALMHDRFGLKLDEASICSLELSGEGYTAKELRIAEKKLEELLAGKPMKGQEKLAKALKKMQGFDSAPMGALLEESSSTSRQSLLRAGSQTSTPKPSVIGPDITRKTLMTEGITCSNIGLYEMPAEDVKIVNKLEEESRRTVVMTPKECSSAVKALLATVKRKAILLNSILQQSLVYQQPDLPQEFFFALFTEWHNRAFTKYAVNMNEVKNPSLLAEYGPQDQDMCVEFRYCTAERAKLTRETQDMQNENVVPQEPILPSKEGAVQFDEVTPVLQRLGISAKDHFSKSARFKQTKAEKPPRITVSKVGDDSMDTKMLKSAADEITRSETESSSDVVNTMADLQAELARTLGS